MADMATQPNRRCACRASTVAPVFGLLSVSAFPRAVRLPLNRLTAV